MKLTSPAFQDNGTIPQQYSCQGSDVNPPLTLTDVPAEAKSLVLILDDPDAPSGTWTHWLVWNIDPTTVEIAEDLVPTGAHEGTTSAKTTGYHGPCPPTGEHRYVFELRALDTRLELPAATTVTELRETMAGHVIEDATLTGRYAKS